MKLVMRFAVAIKCALLLVVSTGFQPAAQQSVRPDIVLNTPNTIRIQSLDDPASGQWVAMPGFAELGSPTFSRDGRWIAFDGYKQGFDNSRAECWIARRDGRELKRLAFGATPRFSPDGKRLLIVREAVNDRTVPEGVYIINRDGSGERESARGAGQIGRRMATKSSSPSAAKKLAARGSVPRSASRAPTGRTAENSGKATARAGLRTERRSLTATEHEDTSR